MFFPPFASVTIKEWQVVLSSVECTLFTGFFVFPPTISITQENLTRKNLFWPFRQAVTERVACAITSSLQPPSCKSVRERSKIARSNLGPLETPRPLPPHDTR